MGKINGCIKCLFIFFNVLFAIIGCVLIYGAVKASAISSQVSAAGVPSLAWIWVFAIGVLGISSLGIYAGCSEKDLALKIFAGFMGVGMIIMLIFGIVVVVMRNKVKNFFDSMSAELAKPYMEDDGLRMLLEGIQQSGQCCGVVSAQDWGDEIPQSCECNSNGLFGSGCKAKPQGTMGPSLIYKQSCSDYIFEWINIFFQIVMGFFFGFAVTALLGLLISILMIHQVKRHDRTGGATIAMKGY
ncbi:23 kDa integral membrane protein-like isoform X2 [Micropterus dolomieu]|uniref:23 kDa integral membrane protein-like isoform X2 n=1 Tax=Micropterus dolomieu TaxID=147949 RepID=UPI001E8E72B1|nr:23 kDa integral membrane protein-like isoform X2 [Micropterus dolomieu]